MKDVLNWTRSVHHPTETDEINPKKEIDEADHNWAKPIVTHNCLMLENGLLTNVGGKLWAKIKVGSTLLMRRVWVKSCSLLYRE